MAVRVSWERADHRRQFMVKAPLFIVIEGRRQRSEAWNLEGATIKEFDGEIPRAGTEIDAYVAIPFQGFDVGFSTQAKCVASDGRELTLEFGSLGERERALLSHFVSELMRGSMAPVEDTIQRIDLPVQPLKLTSDQVSNSSERFLLRPLHAAGMTAIYGLCGLLVFGYLTMLAFHKLFRLEVETAVVSAPLETVASLGEGFVKRNGVATGSYVKAGDVVLTVNDNILEREIEQAAIVIREKQAKFEFLEKRQNNETQRMAGLQVIDTTTKRQLEIEVESLKGQIKAAESELRATPMQIVQGAGGRSGLAARAEIQRTIVTLKRSLEAKEVGLQSRQAVVQAAQGKRVQSGNMLIGELADLEAQLDYARTEVEIAKERHAALVRHRDRLAVRAPFAGRVLDLPHVDNGSVRKGDVLAVIEQTGAHEITAYLNQDEVGRVRLNDDARVLIPALGQRVAAKVREIDRTAGFVREQDRATGPGVRWRGTADRSAKVVLTMSPEGIAATSLDVRAGLPAVVVFDRRDQNSVLDSVRRQAAVALEQFAAWTASTSKSALDALVRNTEAPKPEALARMGRGG